MPDSLGDRMKDAYENRVRFYLTRRTPVICRLDGCHFHSFTRSFERPFDLDLIKAMVAAAKKVAESMMGFRLAYIQSDEASFLLNDYDKIESQSWFDYNKSKIETVSASMMTAFFNQEIAMCKKAKTIAYFDARSFNLPKEEIANAFLWRAKDWERNSLSMYCQKFFSSKELHGKGREEQHEMLYSVGKNWATDLSDQLKNGTFLKKTDSGIVELYNVQPTFDDISSKIG